MSRRQTRADLLLVNATVVTMRNGTYSTLEDHCVAIRGQQIAWVLPTGELADAPEVLAERVLHAHGRVLTPGLIDCHTHLVFGGNRAAEFEERLRGVSYADIAARGGGIQATVRATRDASENDLADAAAERLKDWLDDGVTTVEIKSGYGLDRATEEKLLRAIRRLDERSPVSIVKTFLGAHALPTEYADRPDEYIALVVAMLKDFAAAGMIDQVDGYLESIAFDAAQIRAVFNAARDAGLPVKLHADQLSDSGGAALAAEYGALSADHIEYTTEAGVKAMAAAGTTAVLLPVAFYALRETQAPPIEALREHGVPMAVATDANPGTGPTSSLRLAMNMACVLFGLTPEEALAGTTVHAARALGLDDRGVIEPGLRADLCLWNIETPAELCYWTGNRPLAHLICGGTLLQ